jgi:ferritin-like metal-binding protein YciE
MNNHDLRHLFHHKLKQMWFTEKKIHAALPKMAKAAESDALRSALKKHERETEQQIARLGRIFGMLNKSAKDEASIALGALIQESLDMMVEYKDSPSLDAGLIAGAQGLEHYEIASYGTLKAWAGQLGMQPAAELLEETLAEEKNADETLTRLAEEMANPRAERDEEERPKRPSGQRAGEHRAA